MRNWWTRPWPAALLLALAAELLFLIRLSVPHKLVFDEVHYVPAARTLLALSGPANIEHPLLAKEFIALGIWLFGDVPFGWRVMSTIAGTATMLAVFAIAQLSFGRVRTSIFAAILTLLSFTLYIQARIAMLDTFMLAFLAGGIAALAWSMRRGGWWRWCLGAALLGAATACKWNAAFYVLFAALAFLELRRSAPQRWPGLNPWLALALLGAISIGTYVITFLPAFFYAQEPLTLARLVPFQYEMYLRQTQVLPPHTYQSDWYGWPVILRPIWYLYEPADGAQRGILLLGNPVIMWGGLVAVMGCFYAWVRTGRAALLAPAMLWVASVGIFAIIPKSLGFYYYYYPASIFLCLAIAAAFDHWRERLRHADELFALAAFAMTLYFLPVLTAQALTDAGAFRRWTWFASWV